MTYTISQIQKDPSKIVAALVNLKTGIVVKKQKKPHSVILKFADFEKLMQKLEDFDDALRAEQVYLKTRNESSISFNEVKKQLQLDNV